jgi:acetyl esterase/lipase
MEVALAVLIALIASVAGAAPLPAPEKVTSLTVDQAREYAARKSTLQFDALVELDAAAAAELATHVAVIRFTALDELSPEAARALAAHKPVGGFGQFDLDFRALRQISPETAAALATHVGNLRLPALQRLDSPDLARKLAGQWGEFKVGVTEVSPEIAAILATNEGVFQDRTRPGHVFQRVERGHSVLWFAALPRLEPAVADALAAQQGVLVLNELADLDPAAAAALAKRKGGSLILNGLERLSPETAAALAAYDGEIALRALKEVSPAAATALSVHRGRLHLTGLADVPPETLAILRKHPQVRLPRLPAAQSAPAAVAPPAADRAGDALPMPTHADVRYGNHPKQLLHVWKTNAADTGDLSPLLLFIHGGGWQGGDRFTKLSGTLEPVLAAGISVASVEYRFITEAIAEGIEPPVKAPLHDAARALQFVRSKAAEWGIDKERIVVGGGSAGGCSALWLALHDDLADPGSADPVARESTRPLAVAVRNAQTSLDPDHVRTWIPGLGYGGHAFGFVAEPAGKDDAFARFLAAREKILPWIEEYSPYSLVSADDPPVYLCYESPPPSVPGEEHDRVHSATFGVHLQARLEAVRVPCELAYPGAPPIAHPFLHDAIIAFLKK